MLNKLFRDALSAYSEHLKDEKLLIAVSGGSDSMALLHLCNAIPYLNFEVVTVDHGLRPEAADETRFVAEHCATLNVKHATLNWHPDGTAAQSARLARYTLLAQHAQSIGADAIVLGHTLDDQAETLLMRALRLKDDSSTRGLAGMPEIASYEYLKLLRPLLKVRREQLRNYLTLRQLNWIDDPSNEKQEYERVRVRKTLQHAQSRPSTAQSLPSVEQIGHLARLSGRHRGWLSAQVSAQIRDHVSFDGDRLLLAQIENVPDTVITEIFLVLILACGGRDFRVSERKILDIVAAFQAKDKIRKAVGNCLISVSSRTSCISKEVRKKYISQRVEDSDRELNETTSPPQRCVTPPLTNALAYFRPASDDSIYEAISHIYIQTHGKLNIGYLDK